MRDESGRSLIETAWHKVEVTRISYHDTPWISSATYSILFQIWFKAWGNKYDSYYLMFHVNLFRGVNNNEISNLLTRQPMPRSEEVLTGTIHFQETDEKCSLSSGFWFFFTLIILNLCWQSREHISHAENRYLPGHLQYQVWRWQRKI